MAHLEGLDAGLDDGSEDRFALAGVGKHVWDLVQEAAEGGHAGLEPERSAAGSPGKTGSYLEMTARDSWKLTRKPSSSGTNISAVSETTIICG